MYHIFLPLIDIKSKRDLLIFLFCFSFFLFSFFFFPLVLVKSSRSHTFRDYTGGSPVSNADVYQPEETLNGNFGGMQARGTF
jgi:hypothetical protein